MNKYSLYRDHELCVLLRQDVREAFDVIYERYWQKLYEKANRLLQLSAQAEDIVQDVFVNLWLNRTEYDIESLSAYLHTALRSRVLNYVEREQGKEIFFEPFEMIEQASFTMQDLVREKELPHLVALYINALPRKRKEIFLLHHQEKLNTAEIAALLAISQKTVQNQLTTALDGLRASLTAVLIAVITS